MSDREPVRRRLEIFLLLATLIIPLALGFAWGARPAPNVYAAINSARGLALGGQVDSCSPLSLLALRTLARLGVPLPQVALISSVLGWGAAALAIYAAGRGVRRPVAAVAAASLLLLNPIIVSAPGTGSHWAVALAWVAIAAATKKRWGLQSGALALLLLVHFDWGALGAAAVMLTGQWAARRRFPLWACLTLATVAAAAWLTGAPLPPFNPGAAELWPIARQLWGESDFYWLFLPPVLLGLGAVRREWIMWLAGAGALLLSADAIAGGMAVALGLFLTGLGVDWAVEQIKRRGSAQLERSALATGAALLIGLPLLLAQASSLWQRYQLRPLVRQQLEQEAAEWLRVHTAQKAPILASARVGCLAGRPTLAWDGSSSNPAESKRLANILVERPPQYCVSQNSLAWGRLTRTSWFQDNYASLATFASPYDSASPITIWGYRSTKFDSGERRPLNVQLPGQANLTGCRYWPERVTPGGAVYVTLFWQAPHPIGNSFQPVVRVVSPDDGTAWAQLDGSTRRSVLADWRQTGWIAVERFVLTTTADIPIGAYNLDLAALTPDRERFLPFYQNEDTSPLDRVILGTVIVPWKGEMGQAQPVDARFGEQIKLTALDAPDSLAPGAEFDVTLYWEAQHPPDNDYVVFVHLLDAEGQIAAGHDGPPLEGRYPTTAWLPGDVVPDTHHLALPAAAPPGAYRLQVGMYTWPSLERLPVWDSQGAEQADRAIVLQSIQVR